MLEKKRLSEKRNYVKVEGVGIHSPVYGMVEMPLGGFCLGVWEAKNFMETDSGFHFTSPRESFEQVSPMVFEYFLLRRDPVHSAAVSVPHPWTLRQAFPQNSSHGRRRSG